MWETKVASFFPKVDFVLWYRPQLQLDFDVVRKMEKLKGELWTQ